MSKTNITIERVNAVQKHPNADRLDLIQVLGYQVACGRDQFKVGDAVTYFPPDILIPESVADQLGVTNYLKHGIYPGDLTKTRCRVSACRIRGVPSIGFVIGPVENDGAFGIDVTQNYGGIKYEPPVRCNAGDAAYELHRFHQYTDIENIQNYPDAIPDGTVCRVTEKCHGSSWRGGLVRNRQHDWEFVAGSHRVRRYEFDKSGKRGLYWEPMTQDVMSLLTDLCDEQHDVIVFGEIFGPGIQDMDYGQPGHSFRVFDISIDGVYQNWNQVVAACDNYQIPTVPLLWIGPYNREKIEELTYGPTTLAPKNKIKSKFKGREGVVITPIIEQFSEVLGGRMILKSVSVDYRDRKGALDLE